VPVPGEYPWGTTTFTAPGTIVNPGEAGEQFSNTGAAGLVGDPDAGKLGRCGFAATSTSTRLTAGAGYFGVMELAGNVWEYVYSYLGEEAVYGDGELNTDGSNNVFPTFHTLKGGQFGPEPVSWNTTNFSIGTGRGSVIGGRGVRGL